MTAKDWRYIVSCCCVVATLAFMGTLGVQRIYDRWKTEWLIQQLDSEDESNRHAARAALGDRNVDIIPYLIPLLQHENSEVRDFAAGALNQQIPIPDEVAYAFIAAATDETQEERVRWWACFTLEQIGEQAQEPPSQVEIDIVDALISILHSENDKVVAFAASALREFGPMAAAAESDLKALIDSGSELRRVHVAGALSAIRPSRRAEVLPILLELVQGTDSAASSYALHYITKLGTDANIAIPTLQDISRIDPELTYDIDRAIKLIETESRTEGK